MIQLILVIDINKNICLIASLQLLKYLDFDVHFFLDDKKKREKKKFFYSLKKKETVNVNENENADIALCLESLKE